LRPPGSESAGPERDSLPSGAQEEGSETAFQPFESTAAPQQSYTGRPVAGCGSFLRAVGIFAAIVILLIAGCAYWWSVQPKDVGYDDVLTTTNATTFADHNANWNHDDPNNVAYVQRAMQHLGQKAYGQKFGALMDWEKNYEQTQADRQHAERQAAYGKLHPTPKPLSSAQQAAKVKLPGFRGHFPLCGEGSTNGQETSSCLPLGVPS
jgi:nitrogen fixation-related uncharacterized protein